MIMKKRIALCVNVIGMLFALVICSAVENGDFHVGDQSVSVSEPVFWIRGGRLEKNICLYDNEEDGVSYLFLPTYSITEKVTIDLDSADYARFDDGADQIEIENGKAISNLKEDTLYECTVFRDGAACRNMKFCMMHSKNLPTIFIETESGSMRGLDNDKEYKEAGTFLLVGQDGTVECLDDLNHITGRGNETWKKPKKSYGIKLNEPANLLGMGAADHWVLLSNVTDDIYIRNKITYDMAVAAGMEGAPQSAFVDLYTNGEYHGLYQLTEKVEIDPERIPIRNLERENARSSDNYRTAEYFGEDALKGVLLDRDPVDISGGYLIERDVYEKYAEEMCGFQSTTSQEYYTIKSPERASEAEVAYIRELVSEMEAAVRAPNGINPKTGKSYLEYIDLTSFVKKYLIEEICKNNGGGASSSFFYKPEDSVSSKIFAGPVWDYDKAYGEQGSYNANPRDLEYMTQRLESTTLFRELYKHAEFKETVAACYADFFSDYMQEIYEEKIDACYEEIVSSVAMDTARWSLHYSKHRGDRENVERLQDLKEFVRARKVFLDEVWKEKKEICMVTFREELGNVETSMGVIKGEKLIPVQPKDMWAMPDGMELEGWYDVETGERFDETRPIEKDMVLQGRLLEKIDN